MFTWCRWWQGSSYSFKILALLICDFLCKEHSTVLWVNSTPWGAPCSFRAASCDMPGSCSGTKWLEQWPRLMWFPWLQSFVAGISSVPCSMGWWEHSQAGLVPVWRGFYSWGRKVRQAVGGQLSASQHLEDTDKEQQFLGNDAFFLLGTMTSFCVTQSVEF